MKIAFTEPVLPQTGTVVVSVLRDRRLTRSASELDRKIRGALTRAMKASRFKGFKTHSLHVLAPGGTNIARVFLLGLGKPEEIDALRMQSAGGRIFEALASTGQDEVHVCIDSIEKCKMSPAAMAAELAYGAQLRSYRFDKYRTKEEEEEKPSLKSLKVSCKGAALARSRYDVLAKLADAIFFTRDLVSEPANVIYPKTLAEQAKTLVKLGVKVDILGVSEMKRLGMGALLGVAQGSANEPRLVTMHWNGLKSKSKPKPGNRASGPVAFVGKGVTFDTGGISIKPAAGMEDMKWDMGGSAVVIGLMRALAARKAKVNAVGVIGLVENMPSGTAQRPGDIVRSMSGQTIEVLNTDAEGRLVLADALWYCKERFKPRFMIDLATLTGAIIISLGHEKAGLFSNNDELATRIADAAAKVNEPVWRMPLGEEYDKLLKSDAADMKNIGERGAGSITAAQFLQRFVGKTPWAHLDIAGVAWSRKDAPTVPKGATAFGVRMLERLVADHYEAK